MRRSIASLLVVLLLAGFALPIVQAQTAAPACCRRGGQHHCTTPSTSDGFRSLADCCLYRHLGALTTHGNSALGQSAAHAVNLIAADTLAASISARPLRSFGGNNPQRGPPLS